MQEWAYGRKNRRRKMRPYKKKKQPTTFLWEKSYISKEGGSNLFQDKVKETHIKVSWATFSKKDLFQISEIMFPLACQLPSGKVVTDFTGFSRKRRSEDLGSKAAKGCMPSLTFPEHGRAFPAASARNKHNWHPPSGQSSHPRVGSLNGKN